MIIYVVACVFIEKKIGKTSSFSMKHNESNFNISV